MSAFKIGDEVCRKNVPAKYGRLKVVGKVVGVSPFNGKVQVAWPTRRMGGTVNRTFIKPDSLILASACEEVRADRLPQPKTTGLTAEEQIERAKRLGVI